MRGARRLVMPHRFPRSGPVRRRTRAARRLRSRTLVQPVRGARSPEHSFDE